ncbi:hypothetical protein BsWGS_20559 [Bradybaena similaris]
MERDESAIFFDTIVRESGQFGFFQKRLFIINTLIQSACVSVLLYTCATMPEVDDTEGTTNGRLSSLPFIISPNGYHYELGSNLSHANKTALSASFPFQTNESASTLLLAVDVVSQNWSTISSKFINNASSQKRPNASTHPTDSTLENFTENLKRSLYSATTAFEQVLKNISMLSSPFSSTLMSERNQVETGIATAIDNSEIADPVITNREDYASHFRDHKKHTVDNKNSGHNLSWHKTLAVASTEVLLTIDDEEYKYSTEYNLTSPLPAYLANMADVGNFVTGSVVTSNYGSLLDNVTLAPSGVFILLRKELPRLEILKDASIEQIINITSYAQAAGVILGTLAGSMMADMFGRRRLLYMSLAAMLVLQCFVALSVSWVMFLVVRTMAAGCAGATLVVSFVTVVEFVGPDWRDVCTCSCFWSLGAILLSVETIVTVHWRWLALLSGGVCLPVLATYFVSMESLRWLQCQHRFPEAEWGFREVVTVNSATVPDIMALLDQSRGCIINNMHVKKFTYFDLLYSLNSAKWTVTLVYTSTVSSTVYFCLLWRVREITSISYVNGFLPFLVDLPLIWSVIVMNRCLGRRWCLFLYSVASGFALLSVLILHITGNVDVLPSLVIGLALFGKIGVTASMAIIFIVATEMYPTVTRCMGVAIAVASASVGSMLFHALTFLERYHYTVPFVAYGAMMSSVGFVGLLFPETIRGPLKNVQQCRHRKIPLMEGARLVGRPPRLWEAV